MNKVIDKGFRSCRFVSTIVKNTFIFCHCQFSKVASVPCVSLLLQLSKHIMTDPWSADFDTSGSFRWPCKINQNCLSVCLWDPFINIVYQLGSYKYAHSRLGKMCWINAGVAEFLPIVRFTSVITTMLCRRSSTNIRGISLGFIDQFVFFPCERSDVPISNYQLMAKLPLTLSFQVSPSRSALCCPHSLPQMSGGRKVAQARSLVTRATTDARWVCLIFCISLLQLFYISRC